MRRLSKTLLLLLLVSGSGLSIPALAQDHLFGSIDDPAELPRPAWWMRSSYVEPLAGFSLIGAQWRTAARFRGHFETRTTMVEVDGSFRAGIYGKYDPDTDQAYDFARAVRFARINTPNAYIRVGTPDRTRMGPGLVTDYYQGAAVWDDRRIGLEVALSSRFFRVSGVAADLRMNRMIGGRLEVSPTGAMTTPGGFRIGFGLTTDRRFSADAASQP